jgi:hypothetical protein
LPQLRKLEAYAMGFFHSLCVKSPALVSGGHGDVHHLPYCGFVAKGSHPAVAA